MARPINVEVVFADPDQQTLRAIQVPTGATVADAIAQSGIAESHADVAMDTLQTGIWGRIVERTQVLKDGDRVEIYRALTIDPREVRRQLALSGRTMRDTADKSTS